MMMRGGIKLVGSLCLFALLLAGCAGQRETYAVLPDTKGRAGSLTVTPKAGAPVKLDGAYANAVGKPGSAPEVTKLSEEEIKASPSSVPKKCVEKWCAKACLRIVCKLPVVVNASLWCQLLMRLLKPATAVSRCWSDKYGV